MNRAQELILALVLAVVLLPVICLFALIVLIREGRPVFFLSERMKTVDESFNLIKLRTMTTDTLDSGVTGGDKAARVTATGRFLRRSRIDELPQILNVIRGDIGFVGPRPPLRRYVEQFPDVYRQVLKTRPGITGLATLAYHDTEQRLLSGTTTAEETEQVYVQRCIPAKARLDLLYAPHKSACADLRIIAATLFRNLRPLPRRKK